MRIGISMLHAPLIARLACEGKRGPALACRFERYGA